MLVYKQNMFIFAAETLDNRTMRKLTTSEFIKKAQAVHGSTYDYSKVEYVNKRAKVTIICKVHGDFQQAPDAHFGGSGCQKCANSTRNINSKSNGIEFKIKANAVHGDTYDYSKTNYLNNRTKVTIICKVHGEFEQAPVKHLSGQSCPFCAGKGMNTEEFIRKAQVVHGTIYDYSKVVYVKAINKVTITCKEHGDFEQSPNNHLRGKSCPHCKQRRGYSKTEYVELAEKNYNGMSSIYMIRMWNDTEDFVKIGISVDIERRLKEFNDTDYNIKLLASIQDTAGAVYDFENELHREYKEKKYVPEISFPGQTECFTSDILPDALKYFA